MASKTSFDLSPVSEAKPLAQQTVDCEVDGPAKSNPAKVAGRNVRKDKDPKPKAKDSGVKAPEGKTSEGKKPSYKQGDMFAHLQDLIANDDSVFIIPPFSIPLVSRFMGKTPAVPTREIFPDWVPLQYHFSYAVIPAKVGGVYLPFVHVVKTTICYGISSSVQEFDIEYELFVGCFMQSTVRDYDVLVNSIFMTVVRGCVEAPKRCFDTNAKLEAIAALYLVRHPDLNCSIGVFMKALSEYRPRPAGVYAVGSLASPEFGEPGVRVFWKEERKPGRQHYVARLLDREYHGIIHPEFIPARTKKEFIKGFAKRLTPPPMIEHTINGRLWDLRASRELVQHTVRWYIAKNAERFRSVEDLTREQILDACVKHAEKRFHAGSSECQAYIRGARIALFEDPGSPDFRKCIRKCTDIGTFIKSEGYDAPKPVRFIMCPAIRERGFTHALLFNAQRRLFGVDPITQNPNCVKHMNDQERRDYVINLFGTSAVCNTDYSSMEGSVRARHIEDIERAVFTILSSPDERAKVDILFERYHSCRYHVSCEEYSFYLDPMRLSGQEHTSAGNFLCNVIWYSSIVFMLSGGYYPRLEAAVFEGDDGLFKRDILLENGDVLQVDPDDFAMAAETLGAKLKIDVYANVERASFCGIKLKPAVVEGQPKDELDLDTHAILSKVLWSPSYDYGTSRHDGSLLFARALSYLVRAVGNQELYEALWYLAQTHAPSGKVVQSRTFQNQWIKTFYKGESDDIPEIDLAFDLSKFAAKMHIPDLGFLREKPRILTIEGPSNSLMIEEVLDDIKKTALWANFRHWLKFDRGTHEVALDPNDGHCMVSCIHDYLVRTEQRRISKERYVRLIEENEMPLKPTRDQVPEYVPPGSHIVVEWPDKTVERIESTEDGHTIEAVPLPDVYISVKEGWRTNHARVMRKKQHVEKPIGAPFFIYPAIIAVVIAVLCYLGAQWYFTAEIKGVPVYAVVPLITRGAKWCGLSLGSLAAPLLLLSSAGTMLKLMTVCFFLAAASFLLWLVGFRLDGVRELCGVALRWLGGKVLELVVWLATVAPFFLPVLLLLLIAGPPVYAWVKSFLVIAM